MQFGPVQFATVEFAGAIIIPAAAASTWAPATKPTPFEEIIDL